MYILKPSLGNILFTFPLTHRPAIIVHIHYYNRSYNDVGLLIAPERQVLPK